MRDSTARPSELVAAGTVCPTRDHTRIDRSGSGGFVPSADAEVEGSEGAEVACAIALYGCDATDAAQKIAIIERDAEWNGQTLTFDDSVDDADKKAAKAVQLSSVGIIVRY